MREEITRIVYPVLRYGLGLKPRIQRTEKPHLENEQSNLRALLKSANESRQWPAYGGDGEFLGIRYALTCWLDEIFTSETSPWRSDWNENKLETALYETNDRGWKFWEQARLAEARGDRDALEAFYLCVMLGFRGKHAGNPRALQEWRNGIERQLGQGKGGKWEGEIALPTRPPDVPPLRARDRLRRVMLAVFIALGLCILVGIFQVVRRLGSG